VSFVYKVAQGACRISAYHPEVNETAHTKALRRAAEVLGGVRELRDYLRVPTEELSCWLSGAEAPPTGIFLRVVDLLVEDGEARNRLIPDRPRPTKSA
jgi:hypothetical protein